MNDLRVVSLSLRNFKGIERLTIDAGGNDLDIFGDNATGKTSLFDAFLWLLFDKASDNRKDFGVKTLEPSGEARHGLEHEVEGILSHNGTVLTLQKTFKEKWTKKRGSAERTFEGHTTDYHIDGVPAKKAEYTAKVAEICDEGVFRLLTDPTYFNQIMRWQDRRALLLEICGDISDADVIASDAALTNLPEILGSRSLEDHRKVITAKRTEINREIQSLPTRIDEVSRSLPQVSGDSIAIESDLLQIRTAIQEKHQERARLDSGGEVAEKKRQLAEARAEITEIESQIREAIAGNSQEVESQRRDLANRADAANRQMRSKQQDIDSNKASIKSLEDKMDQLREEWTTINGRGFNDVGAHLNQMTTCTACGQDLPAERLEEEIEAARAEFNSKKAQSLEAIDAAGKSAKAQAGELALTNDRLQYEIDMLEAERDELQYELEQVPEAPQPVSEAEYSLSPEWNKKGAEILTLKAEIEKLGEGNTDALAAVTAEIADMQQQIKDGEAKLAAFKQVVQGNERIEELKAQEKELAAEYERLEGELYLTEEFIRAKVGLLEEKINSRFTLARFKMFNQLINGGLEETCLVTYQGVPYADLNGAAKINIGLDIITTLQEHYGMTAPVWVDNSESVVELLPLKSQLIRLVVSGKDKKLRIETKANLKEAVNG